MEAVILNDKSIEPTNELIFSIIGDKKILWEQTLSYLYDNNTAISEKWKYYNDGKSWLFRTLKKNKTIFWIKVLEDTFRVAFWFGDKLEPAILESNLPDNLKTGFINAQKYGKIRSIYIDIQDSNDIENVKKLINLKLNNK